MAAPVTKVSAMSATLAQRLRDTGSDTSITYTVTSTDPWSSVTSGTMKVNTGASSEWIPFTGVTINSSTSITCTGCTRGLDKDATSLTDNSSGYKKNHGIGTVAYLVLHSATINKFPELDADNTFTGTVLFSGTTGTPKFRFPNYTTAQRDALTGAADGHHIYNTTVGTEQLYSSGAWYDVGTGSTTIALATEAIYGRVRLLTAAADPAQPIVVGSNSTRILDANSQSSANKISLGSVTPAAQATEINLVGDTTYTTGGIRIVRDGTSGGANAVSQILHRGTGSFTITASENADFLFDSTGRFRSFRDPVYSGTAGETLAAGEWVYKKQSDGKLYKADNTTIEKATIFGVVITGGATDATVYAQRSGTWITTGLTAGSTYYLSGTPGALTATSPSRASTSVVPVYIGVASTTTALELCIRRLPRRIAFIATRAAGSGNGTQTITIGLVCDYILLNTHRKEADALEQYGNSQGIYDVVANAQYCNSSASAGGTSTTIIAYVSSPSGSGGMSAVASISSNNLVLTWTSSGTAINADMTGIAVELL